MNINGVSQSSGSEDESQICLTTTYHFLLTLIQTKQRALLLLEPRKQQAQLQRDSVRRPSQVYIEKDLGYRKIDEA